MTVTSVLGNQCGNPLKSRDQHRNPEISKRRNLEISYARVGLLGKLARRKNETPARPADYCSGSVVTSSIRSSAISTELY